jgi:hypothetical protein
MFNFIHPQPVVSRRPVAEMIVRKAARASINAETLLIAKPSRHRQEAPSDDVKALNPSNPLRLP